MSDEFAQGQVLGATMERERIKAIMSLEEAKGREPVALHLAMSTPLAPAEVATVLLSVPLATRPRSTGWNEKLGLELDTSAPNNNAAVGVGPSDDALQAEANRPLTPDEVAAGVNRSHAKR